MVAAIVAAATPATAPEAEEAQGHIGVAWVAIAAVSIAIIIVSVVVVHDHTTAHDGSASIIAAIVGVIIVRHAGTERGYADGKAGQGKEFWFHNGVQTGKGDSLFKGQKRFFCPVSTEDTGLVRVLAAFPWGRC